jgi:type II secretory pathway pseudopilin PulG
MVSLVDVMRNRRGVQRTLARAARASREERGITLVEVVMAMTIFITVAAALAGVMTSSIVAHDLSRERTMAQEAASEQIECIRRLSYQDVGLYPSGNPTGKIGYTGGSGDFCKASPTTINLKGLQATLTTAVSYVDDPGPTSYSTQANYKKVIATVTRSADGKVLAAPVTFVAPIQRAPYGGINNAILNVTVSDLVLNSPVPGATVSLATGPSAPQSDVSDAAGIASFAALTPTTAGPPTDYYDISVANTGYVTTPDDVSPALPAHKQLAPATTVEATIRIFKPATVDVTILNPDSTPYEGDATISAFSSERNSWTTIPVTLTAADAGGTTITTLGGREIVPEQLVTLKVSTPNATCASTSALDVPDGDYPTDLDAAIVVTLGACPTGTVAVNVKQLGLDVSGATVTLTDGPYHVLVTGTTDGSGNVTFSNVPSGSDTYTLTATRTVEGTDYTQTATTTVSTGSTSNVNIVLPNPATGTVATTTMWAGAAVGSCTNCVTLSGGPWGTAPVTGTTNASGQVDFVNVPVGSGYVVTSTKNGVSANQTVNVATGTNTVTVNLPTGSATITVLWGGVLPMKSCSNCVTISGGPNGMPATTYSTNASGVVSIATLAAGSSTAYNVTAAKAGQTAAGTFTLPSGGSTASVSLTMPVGTVNATVRWGATGPLSNGASITITGGPEGGTIATGATNASGAYSNTTLPAGTGTYTIQATKAGVTASSTFTIPSGGSTATPTVTFATRTVVVTVRNGSAALVGAYNGTFPACTASTAGACVSFTGGPEGQSLLGSTNGSSQVTFTNMPISGTTFTAKAWNCGASGSKSRTSTVTVVSGGGSQAVTLQFNVATCPP